LKNVMLRVSSFMDIGSNNLLRQCVHFNTVCYNMYILTQCVTMCTFEHNVLQCVHLNTVCYNVLQCEHFNTVCYSVYILTQCVTMCTFQHCVTMCTF
jgi:uncharacterized membrane protein